MRTSLYTKIFFVTLIAFLLYWLCSVAVPILGVELSYQYKKNWRELVWPQFRVDLTAGTFTTDGIAIPAIFIDEPVIYNVNPNDKKVYLSALTRGIAHASGTAFPGSDGIGYYFAHSSSPALVQKYNAVFYLLGKLRRGDKIYIWHQGDKFIYTVNNTKITSSDDLSFLRDVYSTETIVLQTCWPPGTSIQRLLVFASRVNK